MVAVKLITEVTEPGGRGQPGRPETGQLGQTRLDLGLNYADQHYAVMQQGQC